MPGLGTTEEAPDMVLEGIRYKQRMLIASGATQGACSICGQTYTDPAIWGPESLAEIQQINRWEPEPMQFDACPECWTVGVCPDCLHERECCSDEAAYLR